MESPAHVPVLLDRVVALLAPSLRNEGAVMVDATLGLGGHTEAVLTRCELAGFGERFTAVHAVYDELPEVLDELGLGHVGAVDAVLFDLGVSSMQLDVR